MPYKDKETQRAHQREYARRRIHTDEYKQVKQRRKQTYREEIVRKGKDKPCMDCQGEFPYYVMQYDHRPGEEKRFLVSQGVYRVGKQAILDEIAKCDVVCANCHAVRTFERKCESVGLELI